MSQGTIVIIHGGKCSGKRGVVIRFSKGKVEVRVENGKKCFFHRTQLRRI